ncbi:hypothetical protein BH23VER1_BH23VER1_24450 [soil metagenome]
MTEGGGTAEPGGGCRRLGNWILAALLAGLVLVLLAGQIYPIEFAFYLLAGWFLFLGRVIPQVATDASMLASAALTLAAATALLHVSLRWFTGKNGWSWSPRQTGAVLALLLALFASAIAGAGIGNQVGWLFASDVLVNSSRMDNVVKETRNIRNVFLALKLYAHEHGGRYPENLEDVVRKGYIDEWSSNALSPRDGEPLVYFGAGMDENLSGRFIVLASARPRYSGHKRVVCTNDGSVTTFREEQFQEMLAWQKARLAPAP